jgi:hypothetical protein
VQSAEEFFQSAGFVFTGFLSPSCHDGEHPFKKVPALFLKHLALAFVFSVCNDHWRSI